MKCVHIANYVMFAIMICVFFYYTHKWYVCYEVCGVCGMCMHIGFYEMSVICAFFL